MNDRSGLDLIPITAWVLASLAFLCAVGVAFVFVVVMPPQHGIFSFGTGLGVLVGAFAAGTVLLAGYVYGDSGRRGMPPIPWTALAVLVPNGLGFVIYFLLRKPILHPCGSCGFGIAPDAAFCPHCGQRQTPAN